MLIFVFEFVTGGGTLSDKSAGAASSSLLAQGAAMAKTLVADLDQLDSVEVIAMRDSRIDAKQLAYRDEVVVHSGDEQRLRFRELASSADYTILIAPESNGHLVDRCEVVEGCGGRLLSPGSQFVSLASDKHTTNRLLKKKGVNVPCSLLLDEVTELPEGWNPPFVKKPRWGAGSEDVCLIQDFQISTVDSQESVLELYVVGMSTSVGVLCGPNQQFTLPSCSQALVSDGRFGYLGGSYPLEEHLAQRAKHLTCEALRALPETTGYIGLDIILGRARDGSDDMLIEVNPRLTTSYVALSAACTTNLAGAMLDFALGKRVELSFDDRPLEFTADGKIEYRV